MMYVVCCVHLVNVSHEKNQTPSSLFHMIFLDPRQTTEIRDPSGRRQKN